MYSVLELASVGLVLASEMVVLVSEMEVLALEMVVALLASDILVVGYTAKSIAQPWQYSDLGEVQLQRAHRAPNPAPHTSQSS
jgi:hypothetical protein